MYFYRLSKYSNASSKNEWTSYSDVLKPDGTAVIPMSEYMCIEDAFIEAINIIRNQQNIKNMKVRKIYKLSKTSDGLSVLTRNIKKKDVLDGLRLNHLLRSCLREEVSAFLKNGSKLWVSFGHDYYVHIATEEDLSTSKSRIQSLGIRLEDAEWLRSGMVEELGG